MAPLTGEKENILTDGTNDLQPSSTVSGDSATGKVGLTSFSFRDSTGNVTLPQLSSAGYVNVNIASSPYDSLDSSSLFNIGYGASATLPAFPAIKPMGTYVVPTGKSLWVYSLLVKTSTQTTYMSLLQRSVLWKFCAVALATPAALTLAQRTITGGGLTTGTYRYRVVAVNNVGKTLGSTSASQNVTASNNAITVTITAVTGALYYELYRSSAGGAAGTEVFLAVTESLTFIDVIPDSELGTGVPPLTNTTSGSVDGSAFSTDYGPSNLVVDTLSTITTATALDVIYKNISGERKYLTVTPGTAAGSQVEVPFVGRANTTNDNRIPISTYKGQLYDGSVNDILSLGNTPATGSFNIYGHQYLFAGSSSVANGWSLYTLQSPIIIPSGSELVIGVSANAANATATRNDIYLTGALR